MITHEVWIKTTDIKDGDKLAGKVTRRVKVVEYEGQLSVALESYSIGSRGGFTPHGYPGFTMAEWAEINEAIGKVVAR